MPDGLGAVLRAVTLRWTPASVLQYFRLTEADCTGHLKDAVQRHK